MLILQCLEILGWMLGIALAAGIIMVGYKAIFSLFK
jgi:hypothetical protein